MAAIVRPPSPARTIRLNDGNVMPTVGYGVWDNVSGPRFTLRKLVMSHWRLHRCRAHEPECQAILAWML